MKEKDILYFEEDDTGNVGTTGKQVFVTKRINGKTSHNKSGQENDIFIQQKGNGILDDEIFIGMERTYPKDDENNSEEKKSKQNNKKPNSTKNKSTKNKSTKNKSNKKSKTNQNMQNQNTKGKNSKKKRRRKKRITKIFIVLILLAGVAIFALVSPVFNIKEITVEGNDKISTQTILSLSGLQTEKNIFQNLKSKIRENIKENTYIESVEVHRKLPDTIEIKVEEREVAYQVKVLESYVYLDYQGYILENSDSSADVPTIEGLETAQNDLLNGKRVSSEDIKKFNKILKIMDSAKNIEADGLITKIIIDENNEYILYLKSEKKYVYLGDASDLTNKMLYLQIMLEKEKGNSGNVMLNGDLNDGFKPRFREELKGNQKEEKKEKSNAQ